MGDRSDARRCRGSRRYRIIPNELRAVIGLVYCCKVRWTRKSMRHRPLILTFLVAAVTVTGCKRFDGSLTRGLEEEKSYTRHAMEYHRDHPDDRRGDTVLDTWSTADYIALDVAKQKLKGDWAKPSDQLAFL